MLSGQTPDWSAACDRIDYTTLRIRLLATSFSGTELRRFGSRTVRDLHSHSI